MADHAMVVPHEDEGQEHLTQAMYVKIALVLVAITSAEVATRLGQSKPTVTRARERGDLYALASGGQLWFPAWQFTGDGALPGLRIALADLPPHWPAERLARFMATEDEFLDGLSPVEWLGQRSDPGRVAELLVAESHE